MKVDPVRRESVGGWVRLGLGTFLVLVLPVWSILTASFLQAAPFEEVLISQEDSTRVIVTVPAWVRFFIAASEAAAWLGVFLAVLAVAGAVWWLGAKRQRSQLMEDHARYASASPVQLDLADEAWEVTIRARPNSADNPNELEEEHKMDGDAPAKTPPVR